MFGLLLTFFTFSPFAIPDSGWDPSLPFGPFPVVAAADISFLPELGGDPDKNVGGSGGSTVAGGSDRSGGKEPPVRYASTGAFVIWALAQMMMQNHNSDNGRPNMNSGTTLFGSEDLQIPPDELWKRDEAVAYLTQCLLDDTHGNLSMIMFVFLSDTENKNVNLPGFPNQESDEPVLHVVLVYEQDSEGAMVLHIPYQERRDYGFLEWRYHEELREMYDQSVGPVFTNDSFLTSK